VYGYLSDSLADPYLNETDRAVIASFQACLPSEKNASRIRAAYEKIEALVLFGKSPRPHRKLNRRQREKVVQSFILSLSDNQLATGLALLIAAVANQCTLTNWEFQLAFSLAWFSSTTHLATLDCLRDYFHKHGAVRNWRVFGMIVLLVLLMYSLVMSIASADDTIPVQCTIYFFRETRPGQQSLWGIYDIISAILTLLVLTWQYMVRIRVSYQNVEINATSFERAMFMLRTKRHRNATRPNEKELKYMIEEAVAEQLSY
jgi:hypothetical protein